MQKVLDFLSEWLIIALIVGIASMLVGAIILAVNMFPYGIEAFIFLILTLTLTLVKRMIC